MEFSPLHNVRARTYPAIYGVLTGDNDQRVPPLHSYKLAATLQNTATGPGPYLLHSFAKSGHGIEGEGVRVDAHRMAFFFGTPARSMGGRSSLERVPAAGAAALLLNCSSAACNCWA